MKLLSLRTGAIRSEHAFSIFNENKLSFVCVTILSRSDIEKMLSFGKKRASELQFNNESVTNGDLAY
jgi:hypothetical protein